MKYLVEALDTYEKYNITDNELNEIPKKGKQWKVTKDRLKVLLGDNKHGRAYVKEIKPAKTEVKKATRPKKKQEKATKTR